MEIKKAILHLQATRLMLLGKDNQPISDLYYALELTVPALEKQVEKRPYPDDDDSILACPYCRSGEYLHNPDGNENQYCGQCGQKIDWEVTE